jgi:hypothetical protein
MQIVALSLSFLSILTCRLLEQSGKGETVAGPIQRRKPGLCQGLPGRKELRSYKTSDREESDQGTDGRPRSQQERTRLTVHARAERLAQLQKEILAGTVALQ